MAAGCWHHCKPADCCGTSTLVASCKHSDQPWNFLVITTRKIQRSMQNNNGDGDGVSYLLAQKVMM
jgi:hypothetical protein